VCRYKTRILARLRAKYGIEYRDNKCKTNNSNNEIMQEEQRSTEDVRENSKKGKLPCRARYCHRCHEECGVIVNAYILRDIASESSAGGSSLVAPREP